MQVMEYAGCKLPGVFLTQLPEPNLEAACADNIGQRPAHD
jgi:hypothetical protein